MRKPQRKHSAAKTSKGRSSHRKPRARRSVTTTLTKLSGTLVREELSAISLASQIHHLPRLYTALILRGRLTSVETAHLPLKDRLEAAFPQLSRGVSAFQKIRERVFELAKQEFFTHAEFSQREADIAERAMEQAFEDRSLYLLFGCQELCLVRDVIWPAVKKTMAEKLSVVVEVEDSAYESWLERLRVTF